MGTELIDRRIRKTRKQLKDCLISLLKTKRIQDITVRELTEMADLNRGTFYLHYKDVFDLLEQTETELLGKLNSVIQKHRAEELLDRPFNIFHEVYTLVYENASLVEILLGENGDLNFLNRMKQIMRDKCLHDWMEVVRTESTAVFDAYFAFIVSGCLGLVQHWLKTGLKETPVQMARLTEKSLLTSFMCFPRILWNKASPLKSAVSVKISVAPLSNLWYKRRYSYGRKLKESPI